MEVSKGIFVRVRELIFVLCLVAMVVALIPKFRKPVTPEVSATPSSQVRAPELSLKVVRRGRYLNDLIVMAQIKSPDQPIGLYLRENTPVAYLGIDHQRRSWDLAPKVFSRDGYPNHLDPTKLHDEIREVREFEWEFWGRELSVPDRDQVDGWLAGRVGFTVRLPYKVLQDGPGRRRGETRSLIAQLPEEY